MDTLNRRNSMQLEIYLGQLASLGEATFFLYFIVTLTCVHVP